MLLQRLTQAEDNSAYLYLKESCDMMQKISEDIYKKELNKLKIENKDLTELINTLRKENTELRERLLNLMTNKKSVTSEPLEVSFEEKLSKIEDIDLNCFKGSIAHQINTFNDINASPPKTENSFMDEDQSEEENNTMEACECKDKQSKDEYIPNYVHKLLQTAPIDKQDLKRNISKPTDSYLTEETLETDRTNISGGKSSTRGNTTTPRTDKLIAGLILPVKQKIFSKLGRGKSPVNSKVTGKSPRPQIPITSSKKKETESEFATPHFN